MDNSYPWPWKPPQLLSVFLDHLTDSLADRAKRRHYRPPRADPLKTVMELFSTGIAEPLRRVAESVKRFEQLDEADATLLVDMAARLAEAAHRFHRRLREILVQKNAALLPTPAHQALLRWTWLTLTQSALWSNLAESCESDGRRFIRYPWAALVKGYPYEPCVLDAHVSSYTVLTWSNALDALLDVWDVMGWTPENDRFLTALVMRYGMLIEASHAPQSNLEPETVFNEPVYCTKAGAGAAAAITGRRLTVDFVDLVEPRLFPLWDRCRIAATWFTTSAPLAYDAARAKRTIDGWVAFARAVATDTMTHGLLLDQVQDGIARRLLRCGEMLLHHSDDAESALWDERRHVFMKLQKLQKKSMLSWLEKWQRQATNALVPTEAATLPEVDATRAWEEAARGRSVYDALALLVFEKAMDTWLQRRGVLRTTCCLAAQSFVDDASLPYPYDLAPLDAKQALAGCANRAPVLVVVARLYAVVDAVGGAVRTPLLADALTAWVRQTHLMGEDVPQALRPLMSS